MKKIDPIISKDKNGKPSIDFDKLMNFANEVSGQKTKLESKIKISSF